MSTYAWDSYAALDPAEAPGTDAAPLPGAAARCLNRLLDLANNAAPVARALDLGCGAGGTSFALAARHPDALVLGADLNLGLLRLARRAAAGRVTYPRRRIGLVYDRRSFPVALPGASRVDFWACDATALPLRDGTADLVAALNLLDCVAEPSLLLAELSRVLAPRGHLLLATPYDWSTRATQPAHWIGGHSQRAAHAGTGEKFLRDLLSAGAHPQSVTGLHLCGEVANWPWHTRLHDRAAMRYETHLLALQRAADA
jgi:SAM-dependent methyltransferase